MATFKTPNLYEDDLITLTHVLNSLEDIARIEGVFSCEIRVKLDYVDSDSWIVVGWGDATEPAILRFEDDEPALKVDPQPKPDSGKIQLYTINSLNPETGDFFRLKAGK